ncbi:hypothetical protein A6A20_07195 [Volucribacter amazonae]|uniref:Uncharacterized protein n=1 Tax=Volucribacter amazonae TaxID=256731 RepID=A0A9X4SQJ4_9PAST|nr:hypothetical protein [Volucribacter amazonae]
MEKLIAFLIVCSKLMLVYVVLPCIVTKLLFKFTFLNKYSYTDKEDNLQAIILVAMMLVMYFLERKMEIL